MGTFFFQFFQFTIFGVQISKFSYPKKKEKQKKLKKKKKDFAAARLATISATRWTGNKLFFKGGPIVSNNNVTLLDIYV